MSLIVFDRGSKPSRGAEGPCLRWQDFSEPVLTPRLCPILGISGSCRKSICEEEQQLGGAGVTELSSIERSLHATFRRRTYFLILYMQIFGRETFEVDCMRLAPSFRLDIALACSIANEKPTTLESFLLQQFL